MSFYYVQDVYQKNLLGTRLDKRADVIPRKKIISRKASIASVKRAGWSGGRFENSFMLQRASSLA